MRRPPVKVFTDRRVFAGAVALAAVGVLIGGAFLGLAVESAADWSGGFGAFDPYLLRVAQFTLWQALLSTVLSVVPAILLARALARHPQLPGRSLLLRLFALPLALPAIVAALGILALLGRGGLFAEPISQVTGERWQGIYGLAGILVAHVFFNLPLATRLLLQSLETIPADQWRLAAQLGMGGRASFRFLEWPVLRKALPGVAGLVFMLCVTSFTIVLTLGGGPRATTLEVAIYQALRFSFEPSRAVALTLVQVGLTVVVVALLMRLGANMAGDASLPVAPRRPIHAQPGERLFNTALIMVALVFVAAPIAAIVVAGLRADIARLARDPSVHAATLTSLGLALAAAIICVILAIAQTAARRALEIRRGRTDAPGPLERLLDTGAGFVLVIPPIVVGAGWFVLLRHGGAVFSAAPFMVVAVNAAMALPFALRVVRPAYDAASERHERLCASLGIGGMARWRLVDWPSIRRPAMTALAFAMALSLGDLGVIALFGSDQVQTLPYLLLARMGSYRTDDAAGLALLLGVLCMALMVFVDRSRQGA